MNYYFLTILLQMDLMKRKKLYIKQEKNIVKVLKFLDIQLH